MKTLVIASHNRGKVREIGELLKPLGIEVKSAAELGLPEPEENGTTFEENAAIKALSATKHSGLPALADDSGLAIPALNGEPGIYSARWAGESKDFDLAMNKIQSALNQENASENSEAYFVCSLALASPEGEVQHFNGEVWGNLSFPPKGENGFGYDPIFIPKDHNVTFAQMNPNNKQEISHRAKAFALLKEYLEK